MLINRSHLLRFLSRSFPASFSDVGLQSSAFSIKGGDLIAGSTRPRVVMGLNLQVADLSRRGGHCAQSAAGQRVAALSSTSLVRPIQQS